MQRWTDSHGKIAAQISPVYSARSQFLETSTMPDIAKSDISPNLDRDKMFNELWWLNYCFCEGVGIGAVGNPFFGGEAVNICLHSRCEMTDVGDPFCLQHPRLPVHHGPVLFAPSRRISNLRVLQQKACGWWWMEWPATLWLVYQLWWHLLALLHLLHGSGLFCPASQWPSFVCCPGEGAVHAKGGTKLTTPMEGGKLCSMVSTRLCFWEQCALPPAEGAPMFVCFNLLNKKGASAKPLAYGSWDPCVHLNATDILECRALRQSQPGSTTVLKMMWLVFPKRANLPSSCRRKGRGDAAQLHCCSHLHSVTVTLAKNSWNKRKQETYAQSHQSKDSQLVHFHANSK